MCACRRSAHPSIGVANRKSEYGKGSKIEKEKEGERFFCRVGKGA
jgi:hypothetical protein